MVPDSTNFVLLEVKAECVLWSS